MMSMIFFPYPSHLHLRQVQVFRGANGSERRSNPHLCEEIASPLRGSQ
jgi:hypothetical protein